MKFRGSSQRKPKIEVIPMIDVMFFLLIFFMMTSSVRWASSSLDYDRHVAIQLPVASENHHSDYAGNVEVSIDAEGKIFLSGVLVDIAHLGVLLVQSMQQTPQQVVVIRADKHVAYGFVIEVMNSIKYHGVHKFALATSLS